MVKRKVIPKLECPRCKGSLMLWFPEDDDSTYVVEKEMSIGVECWECNIRGTAHFKLTDLDITDDEAEEAKKHTYRCTCLNCKEFFIYDRWEGDKRKFANTCYKCNSKNVENIEVEWSIKECEWIDKK